MKFIDFIEKYWLFFLVLVAAAVAGLALILSIGQPVWFDEGYSILLAKSSFSELFSLTGVDAHPPLYYVLLKIWGSIFGFSEIALRSLSAVLMGSAVAVAVATLRRIFSTKVALAAVPFIIFAPFLLRYGYEIRMYALATLIGVSATYALVRAREATGRAWWVAYAALVALGMYTLYLMAAVWLAHAVWLLAVSIKAKKGPWWHWSWLYAFAGAVVLFLPYMPTFFRQLTSSALPGMGNEVTAAQLVNIGSTFTLYLPEWVLGGWGTIVLIAVVVILSTLATRVYRTLNKKQKQYMFLFVSLSVVPVAFYALTSLPPSTPIFIVRYMAHSAIFIYVLMGLIIGLALYQKKLPRKQGLYLAIGTAIVLATLAIGVTNLQRAGNFNFERMQQPMTYEVQKSVECGPDTIVVADDPYTFIDSVFYFENCNLHFFSKDEVAFKGGYAILNQSKLRISSPEDLSKPTVVHLRWVGDSSSLALDSRYQLVSSVTFDKQVVDTYWLIGE